MLLTLIKQTVGDYFGVDLEDQISNHSRRRENVETRMIYFHLARIFTKKSLGYLGRTIKPHKNHATVLNNIVKTKNLLCYDKDFKRKHNDIKSMIEHYMKNNNYESMSISQKEFEIIRLHKENLKIIKRNRALLVEKSNYKKQLSAHRKYLLQAGYNINNERSSVFNILSS